MNIISILINLVSGGAGLIGSYIIDNLFSRNNKVSRASVERLDLLLLALETIDLNGNQSIFNMAEKLDLKETLPSKVYIWKLRCCNPMRKTSTSHRININEFDKGNSVGRYSTEEKLYSSPLIFENNLIIHTQESKLLFFKVKTRDMYYCLNLNEEKICN